MSSFISLFKNITKQPFTLVLVVSYLLFGEKFLIVVQFLTSHFCHNSLYFLFCCLLFSPVTQLNSGLKLTSKLAASNMKRLKPNFWLFLSTKDPARVIDNAFKMNSFHPDIALFHIFFLSNKSVEFSDYYIWKAYRDLTCITRDGLSLIMTRLIGIVTEKLNKLLDAVRTQVKDFNYFTCICQSDNCWIIMTQWLTWISWVSFAFMKRVTFWDYQIHGRCCCPIFSVPDFWFKIPCGRPG